MGWKDPHVLAVMAQQVETDGGSTPKVVWYDADGTFNIKTIKEIAFRMRKDPEEVAQNIVLVDVYGTDKMELSLETLRRILLRSHVALVIIDSLWNVTKCLKLSLKPWDITQPILRLAINTGIVFATTSKVHTRISSAVHPTITYYRSISAFDYRFGLQPRGEKMREIILDRSPGDEKVMLYIGYGGFFEDRGSMHMEARGVERYLRRLEKRKS